MYYLDELRAYLPKNEQEKKDKEVMLSYVDHFGEKQVLTRENQFAHFTGSSLIFNESFDKTLMVYHNIYKSWSWTGGHADSVSSMFEVALAEAKEETGLSELLPLNNGKLVAIDILPVWGHVKRGAYVSSHQHLSFSYLFKADEAEHLESKPDENSGVEWVPIDQIDKYVTEPEMLPVYNKIIKCAQDFKGS
jgi:8-oxo-dGTP pyrophosphatase MutT (NUDIX family)